MCVAIGGLARYGNGNSIMNIGVEQEHLFYAIHSGGDEFCCVRGAFEEFEIARKGSEASSHKFTQ